MGFDAAAAEAERLKVQASLDESTLEEERLARGQFATPPQVALEMAHYAKAVLGEAGEPIRFCEPFLGTGTFYSALRQAFPAERVASAVGIEIDPEMAKAAAGLWHAHGLRILNNDFADVLRLCPDLARPNLIFASPPAFEHGALKPKYREAIEQQILKAASIRVSGLAPYFVYAFLLASEWLDEGGLGAWLIPSDFMGESYGDVLRKYLTERVKLLRIHRFDPRGAKPDDAWASSAVVVFRKTRPEGPATAQFTFRGTLENPIIAQDVGIQDLIGNPLWVSYPFVRVQLDTDPAGDSLREDAASVE